MERARGDTLPCSSDLGEQSCDVYLAMLRCVRREPARSLLQLAPCRDRAATSGLVPGDGDVDEPLEEVPLLGQRRAPCCFELLVRFEVASRANLLEPALECSMHGALTFPCVDDPALWGRPLHAGKLEALLPGHRLITADHTEDPELVLADVSRIDPDEVADRYPDVPIVGFTNHTDTSGLRAAHAAGFDQVLAKSALGERLGEVVTELADSPEP